MIFLCLLHFQIRELIFRVPDGFSTQSYIYAALCLARLNISYHIMAQIRTHVSRIAPSPDLLKDALRIEQSRRIISIEITHWRDLSFSVQLEKHSCTGIF